MGPIVMDISPILRSAVPFLRQEVLFFAGLQEAQVVSLIGGIAAVAFLWYLSRREMAGAAVPGASIPLRTPAGRCPGGRSRKAR